MSRFTHAFIITVAIVISFVIVATDPHAQITAPPAPQAKGQCAGKGTLLSQIECLDAVDEFHAGAMQSWQFAQDQVLKELSDVKRVNGELKKAYDDLRSRLEKLEAQPK